MSTTLYLCAWASAAWMWGQRGTAGFDLDRRGAVVLTTVSLVDVAAVLLLAPLALAESFSRSSPRGRARLRGIGTDVWQRSRRPVGLAAGFAALSTALSLGLWIASSAFTGGTLLDARLVVAASGAAASALALMFSAWFEDVHDAIGATYATLAAAVGAMFLAAPAIAVTQDAGRLIAGVLTINPFVAAASATNFDLLRTELLYRTLPFGQRLFEYPVPAVTASLYAATAACCVGITFWFRSKEVRCA